MYILCMTTTQRPKIPLTRNEAAARAGVQPRTIDYWRRTKKITTFKDGRGHVWLDAEEIDALSEIKPVSA
jgi:hypothetical protein